MTKQKETLFKEKVLGDLRSLQQDSRRLWFVKTQMVATRGIPDILVVAGGVFFALELKAKTSSRVDKLQLHILSQIHFAGGYAQIVTPELWPHVFDKIRSNAVRGTKLADSRLLDG